MDPLAPIGNKMLSHLHQLLQTGIRSRYGDARLGLQSFNHSLEPSCFMTEHTTRISFMAKATSRIGFMAGPSLSIGLMANSLFLAKNTHGCHGCAHVDDLSFANLQTNARIHNRSIYSFGTRRWVKLW